jgi:hypothetical protein
MNEPTEPTAKPEPLAVKHYYVLPFIVQYIAYRDTDDRVIARTVTRVFGIPLDEALSLTQLAERVIDVWVKLQMEIGREDSHA